MINPATLTFGHICSVDSGSAACSCTCSTDSIWLCLRLYRALGPSVILPDRKQVGVHCARVSHSTGVSAVPVIPLCHQSHHQILQFCQLHLRGQRKMNEMNPIFICGL